MTSLYLCYQGVDEPLTRTQVVAYLEGLARAGYRPVLLTFEPRPLTRAETVARRAELAAVGVRWHWLRYHKRPTVPATAFDIVAGVVYGWWLCERYGVRLLHARVHVPGLMAVALKRLTGAKLLFDIRGFMAEEYADAGVWPAGGRLFRACKRVERAVVRAADGLVVLTRPAAGLLGDWYPREVRGKPLEVIPCCVDLRDRPAAGDSRPGPPALGYVGKLGGWYAVDAMVGFAAAAAERMPGLRWWAWTQSDPELLRRPASAAGLSGILEVGRVPPAAVPAALRTVHAGLALYRPGFSLAGCSPTKLPEYLAAGLPVVATAGIGDTNDLLVPAAGRPVGVLVREFTPAAFARAADGLRELLADPDAPARCRAAAEAHYSLEAVGWPAYRRLYGRLLGGRQ